MEFEKTLSELEEIVKKLESDVKLDEAISLFQKGIELSRTCIAELKEQKGKILLLTDEMKKLTEELNVD